jgi:hypothetical protein
MLLRASDSSDGSEDSDSDLRGGTQYRGSL